MVLGDTDVAIVSLLKGKLVTLNMVTGVGERGVKTSVMRTEV